MRRSLGGGSSSSSGGKSMGGGGGSGVQMLRGVQRAVRASASGEPFSHSTSGSKNPTSAGRKAGKSTVSSGGRGNSLALSSSLTSGNVPVSASSSTWPSSPTFSDDSFDWVSVDGLEDDRAQPVYDDYVFGSVPSVEEVNLAVLALKQVLDPGSPTNMAKDKSLDGNDTMNSSRSSSSSTGTIQVATPFGAKLDWIEPSSQLWSSSLSQGRGYDIANDAFNMLRNEPSIQRMVVSLSSDRAVWDAVLNNQVVQELREAFSPADIASSEKSDDGGDASNIAKSFISWIIDNTKARVKEFVEMISKIVNDIFHAEEEDGKPTDKGAANPFEDKLRASFFLSIVVMLIVVVGRTRA